MKWCLSQQTDAFSRIPPWALWAAMLVGIGCLVYSIVRHSRRIVRSTDADAPASDAQRRWSRERAARPRGGADSTEAPDELDRRLDELRELVLAADSRIAELKRLERSGAAPTKRAVSAAPTAAPEGARGERSAARVYELADEGRTPQQIAAITGQSVSEISLMLALR